MASNAGTIIAGAPPNDRWRRCDGSAVSSFLYPDYKIRVGGVYGLQGLMGLRLPAIPGSSIAIDDDPADYATAPPVNVDVPSVTQAGAILSCTFGNWQNTPTTYAYQWAIDGTNAGTNAATLTVTAADVGKSATCVVTASNAAGSTAAPSSVALVIGDIAA